MVEDRTVLHAFWVCQHSAESLTTVSSEFSLRCSDDREPWDVLSNMDLCQRTTRQKRPVHFWWVVNKNIKSSNTHLNSVFLLKKRKKIRERRQLTGGLKKTGKFHQMLCIVVQLWLNKFSRGLGLFFLKL